MKEGLKIGKFWFSSNMPDEVIDTCKTELTCYEDLVPSWCEEVRVYFDALGAEPTSDVGNVSSAYIETNYAYRFASLYICPPFLLEEKSERTKKVIHELCHIVSSPVIQYTRDIAIIVSKDDIVSELVTRESSEKIESMTEDLSNIIYKLYEKINKKSK